MYDRFIFGLEIALKLYGSPKNDQSEFTIESSMKAQVGLPSLERIYRSGVQKRMHSTIDDEDHPGHSFFQFLPSKRRFRNCKGSKRFLDSFYASATRLKKFWLKFKV